MSQAIAVPASRSKISDLLVLAKVRRNTLVVLTMQKIMHLLVTELIFSWMDGGTMLNSNLP